MQALFAIACAVAVVTCALRGVPRRIGVMRALCGLATLVAAGYVWLRLMWIVVPQLAPLFSAIPGVHLKGLAALLLFLAPPTLAALAVVRLVAVAGRRARMAG